MPKKARRPTTRKPSEGGVPWLPRRTDAFWIRLQIYPEAIRRGETHGGYETKATVVLKNTGPANLRYLCERAKLEYRPELDSAEQLANRLLSSQSKDEIVFLATFLRVRKNAVVEVFEKIATKAEKSVLESDLAEYSRARAETLKPFTKLVWLYSENPDALEAIQFCHAWRRLPSSRSYTTPEPLTLKTFTALREGMGRLVSRLNKVRAGETYEEFGSSQMTDTLTIYVVHRCFPPSVRSDYQQDFRVQHDFSTIAFAVDVATSSFVLKIANRALADTVRDWICDELQITLEDAGATLFNDYEPYSVEHALLGGYDQSHGIDLTSITLRQSFGPNHSPLAVKSAPFSRSVREDLGWLRSKEVIRIRSLSDVLELSLRFEDLEVTVSGVVEKGGSVRFKLNDSGLTEDQLSRLKGSFADAFLVPLEQSIDPTILAMGPSEIYQFLLSGVAASEIQQYQRRPLDQLINWGLLSKHTKWKGSCTDKNCKSHSQVVLDRSLTECPTCQGSLEWKSDEVYEENRKALAKVTKALIEKATGGKMNFPPHAFESHKFYRLTFRDAPDQTVCVCLNDRLNPAKIDVFQRAMFPVLVIHPQGLHRSPVIDPHGLAHAGLPYLLAARESRDEWKKVRTDCKAVVQRLRQMEKERVLRASRHSHDYLTNKPADYNDRNFEADVYNLLRSVFAFTVKWGGPNKPDGFSSLVYFPQNDLAAPAKFNWSYDAKYSDTTYSFAIAEFRQMFDYISILHRPKGLQSVGNRYDAHAIITNSMNETAMRGAADYLWTEHRLGKEWPDFVLLFVRDTFIRRLWELVRDNETGLEQRGTYLAEFFVRAIKESVKDGYCLFEERVAETLVHDVMSQAPLQDPVDARKLRLDLKKEGKRMVPMPGRSRRS